MLVSGIRHLAAFYIENLMTTPLLPLWSPLGGASQLTKSIALTVGLARQSFRNTLALSVYTTSVENLKTKLLNIRYTKKTSNLMIFRHLSFFSRYSQLHRATTNLTGVVIVAAHHVADLVTKLAAQEGLHQLNGALALGTLGRSCDLKYGISLP